MQKTSINASSFRLATTYIGTVTGAGFASGQEILQFFGAFGNKGLAGLLLATIFFIIYGYIIMDLGYRIQSTSYLEIIKLSGGKYFQIIADSIISFFLFGSVVAMIAASGALYNQQFETKSFLGQIIMTVITIIAVFAGIKGLIGTLRIMVPILLAIAVGTSIMSLYVIPHTDQLKPALLLESSLMGNWFWSALLYVSYNIATAIAVLGPLGREAKDRKAILMGAIMGGLGLGVCALGIYLAITNNLNNLDSVELPMLLIANNVSPIVQNAYLIVLFAAIFATSASSLFGLVVRMFNIEDAKVKVIVPILAFLALIAGQFGFSNLVRYMYPLEGFIGIILLVGLLYSRVKISSGSKN